MASSFVEEQRKHQFGGNELQRLSVDRMQSSGCQLFVERDRHRLLLARCRPSRQRGMAAARSFDLKAHQPERPHHIAAI